MPDEIGFHLDGTGEFNAAIERLIVAADAGAREIVTKGGHLIEAEAKKAEE